MDSTLIKYRVRGRNRRCRLYCKAEVAAITEAAMQGVITD